MSALGSERMNCWARKSLPSWQGCVGTDVCRPDLVSDDLSLSKDRSVSLGSLPVYRCSLAITCMANAISGMILAYRADTTMADVANDARCR